VVSWSYLASCESWNTCALLWRAGDHAARHTFFWESSRLCAVFARAYGHLDVRTYSQTHHDERRGKRRWWQGPWKHAAQKLSVQTEWRGRSQSVEDNSNAPHCGEVCLMTSVPLF